MKISNTNKHLFGIGVMTILLPACTVTFHDAATHTHPTSDGHTHSHSEQTHSHSTDNPYVSPNPQGQRLQYHYNNCIYYTNCGSSYYYHNRGHRKGTPEGIKKIGREIKRIFD